MDLGKVYHAHHPQLFTTTQSIISKMDKGKCMQAAIMDFAKALHKVPHNLLIYKLLKYDFPGNVLW